MDPSLDAVLPPGVEREPGVPPPPPLTFDDGYVLPEHSEKPLQRLHRHPSLDDHLLFYEKPHVYTFRGVPLSASVTALAHAYDKPFVATEAISMMKSSRSQRWPRLEYVVDARPLSEWTPERGALVVKDGKTIAVVQPHSMRSDGKADVKAMLRAAAGGGGGEDDDLFSEAYSFSRARTDEEIAEGWAKNGMRASHLGTEAHYLAECFFNGVPFRWWERDMAVLYDFARAHLLPDGIVAYNTEKEIVCEDADLAGSIDLILWDAKRGVHHILDFKRSEKLRLQMRGYGKMAPPFDKHLDDCKGAGYALQCSIYQYVLEREYGLKIGSRVLLSLHPDSPFATKVPYLAAEVEHVMEGRFSLVRARRACAKADPERCSCAATGAPLVDAVRVAASCLDAEATSGTVLVSEKMALVREWPHEADLAARAHVDEAVEAARDPVPELDRSACTPWRKQMPEGGLCERLFEW